MPCTRGIGHDQRARGIHQYRVAVGRSFARKQLPERLRVERRVAPPYRIAVVRGQPGGLRRNPVASDVTARKRRDPRRAADADLVQPFLAMHRHCPFSAKHLQCCDVRFRSEEHTSELQSLMRISYAVFCLKKNKKTKKTDNTTDNHKQ